MTAITIDLPEAVLVRLTEQASAAQTSLEQFVSTVLAEVADADAATDWDTALSAEDLAAIGEGRAAAQRGDLIDHEEAMALVRAGKI
jgi:predicted transcriptional regulator